jgi:hypothetical protein
MAFAVALNGSNGDCSVVKESGLQHIGTAVDILLLDSVGQRRQNLVDTLEFLEHALTVPARVTQGEASLEGRSTARWLL